MKLAVNQLRYRPICNVTVANKHTHDHQTQVCGLLVWYNVTFSSHLDRNSHNAVFPG